MSNTTVPVTLAPFAMDIDRARQRFTMPEGMTVAEIVTYVRTARLQGLSDFSLPRVRVVLISPAGKQAVVPQEFWRLVRPHAGTAVVITIAPGAFAMTLLIQLAAKAISGLLAPGLASTGLFGLTAAQWAGIIGFGIPAVGGPLSNGFRRQASIGSGSQSSRRTWRTREPSLSLP